MRQQKIIQCVTNTEPDKLGRQGFTLRWWANNIGRARNETGWRYQEFYAVVDEHRVSAEKDGKEFIILAKFD
jgi:hypothetical protein